MKGTLYLATHDVGLGTFFSGGDPAIINRTISEGLIGLITDKPNGTVQIFLRDGETITAYRLTVDQVISDKEMTFRLVKIE